MLAKPGGEIGPRLLEGAGSFQQHDRGDVLPIQTRPRASHVRRRFVVTRNPRWKAGRKWPVSEERNLRREAADEDALHGPRAPREIADKRRVTRARLDLGRRVHEPVGDAPSLPHDSSRGGY